MLVVDSGYQSYSSVNGSESGRLEKRGNHSPILINGDEELIAFPEKTGSGTMVEPFIIENMEIYGNGETCIKIIDTTLYFTIRNCILFNSKTGWEDGIHLDNCMNVAIINCTIRNNDKGVYLLDSKNVRISGNNIADNSDDGFYLYYSNNITILENNIIDNGDEGIYSYHSEGNTIMGNNVTGNKYCGVYLLYSDNTTIIGNNITDNGRTGIDLRGGMKI